MMKFLRSQSQLVLIVIVAVLGLSFFFYGSTGNLLVGGAGGRPTANDFGRIDGQEISAAQLYDAIRDTRLSLMLRGRSQDLQQPGARAGIAEEAWRQLLFLHEADRLHIDISDRQLVEYIQRMPVFQKNGAYDPQQYQAQMSVLESNYHITPDTFERVLKNNLRLEAVSQALFSSIRATAGDVVTQYEKYYGPSQVSLVSFAAKDFLNASQASPAEIEAEYKAHPDDPAYRTKEKRKVDYVLFSLTPDQIKLAPKDRAAAKEALGQKALDFALALQPEPSASGTTAPAPDFLAEAKKEGLNPATSDFFAADATPANVPPSPSFNNAAFALTKDNAVSGVIDMDTAVAVLHLAGIQGSELRPLAEVQADIQKTVQQRKATQAAEDAARKAAQDLQAAVTKGTDFKAAATALNLKVETIPAFVPAKTPSQDERLGTISYLASTLAVGQVSEPVPAADATLVLHLDSRAKADPAGLAEFETRFRQSRDEQLRQYAYVDWANAYNRRTGTHKPPELDQFGSAVD